MAIDSLSPNPVKDFRLVLLAFLKLDLKMNGMPTSEVIFLIASAVSRIIFSFSTTQGPAISTKGLLSPITI